MNPTIEFLLRSRPNEVRPYLPHKNIPANRVSIPRLGWRVPGVAEVTEAQLAEEFERCCLHDTQFVLDTGFITDHEIDPSLWDALLTRRVVITPAVWQELQPWIANPFYNRKFRDRVIAAKEFGDSAIAFLPPVDPDSTVGRAVLHYIRLLSFRKEAMDLSEHQLRQRLGRHPTEQELNKHCQRMVKDRGWQLARKGRADAEKDNWWFDEATIVRAVVDALTSGRETTILTRDNDFLEQFYKLLYLMDSDYRSMLIADQYSKQPQNFPEWSVPKAGIFEISYELDDAKFISFPVGYPETVLPSNPSFVVLYCYCLGGTSPKQKLTPLTFCAEREMCSLLEMKGLTDGRNTNLLGLHNLHLCIHPQLRDVLGGQAIVAKDKKLNSDPPLAISDCHFVLLREERITRSRLIDEGDGALNDDAKASWSISSALAAFRPDVRLGFSAAPESWYSITLSQISDALSTYLNPVALFADRSFLGKVSPDELIDQSTGMHLSTTKRVLEELQSEPANGQPGSATKSGRRSDGLRIMEWHNWRSNLKYAAQHYSVLLSHKKLIGRILMRDMTEYRGHVSILSECEKECLTLRNGERRLRRAAVGWASNDVRIPTTSDELLVHGVMRAIVDGIDVILLTCDPTFQEDFISLCATLERDYLAMVLSSTEDVMQFASKLRTERSPDLERMGFLGPIHVRKMDQQTTNSHLPRDPIPISLHCWLFDAGTFPDLKFIPMSFLAERPMYQLFETKGKLDGRNTDQLGSFNSHFAWRETNGRIIGELILCEDKMLEVGARDIPIEHAPELPVKFIPAFDVVSIQNFGDPIEMPWHRDADPRAARY